MRDRPRDGETILNAVLAAISVDRPFEEILTVALRESRRNGQGLRDALHLCETTYGEIDTYSHNRAARLLEFACRLGNPLTSA